LIEIKNCSFWYTGSERANLDNLSLRVETGECVLVTGESGCGKTTLLRLINGLVPHFYEGDLRGSVSIDGLDVKRLTPAELSTRVASVFQNPRSQFFNLDTTSEIVFGCENMGLPREEIAIRLEEAMETLNIGHLRDRDIFALSGGEKQLVAIAGVYAMRADIFVFDEPSANLDTAAAAKLAEVIRRLKALGKTILIAEHRLAYLGGAADRVLYLKGGDITRTWDAKEFSLLPDDERKTLGLRASRLDGLKPSGKTPESGFRENLKVSGLEVSYVRSRPVLKDMSLSVNAGDATAIYGGNGKGKSTFARCVCGLMRERRGLIQIGGEKARPQKRIRSCYLVMQYPDYQLCGESVWQEIGGGERDDKETRKILSLLALDDLKDRHPFSLSGGEKQRLSIAVAMAQNAEIIILDEPTSGLDYANMLRIDEVISLLRKSGKTVLVITHDYEFLLSACNKVFNIEHHGFQNCRTLDGETMKDIRHFFEIT
jgi:energy-coupling factor transport system ATP-binding protein